MNRRSFLPLVFSSFFLFSQTGCDEQAKRLEELLAEENAKIECVGKRDKGDPNIILIPILHQPKTEARAIDAPEAIAIVKKLKDISFKIYDSDFADTLLMEGVVPKEAEKLRELRKITRKGAGTTDSQFFDEYTEIMLGRDWNLPGIETENENHQSTARLIGTKYELKFFLELRKWKQLGFLKSKEAFEAGKSRISEDLSGLVNDYMAEMKDYFETQDPKGEKLFYELVQKRNEGAWQAARAQLVSGAKGTLNVFGAAHERGIREQIEKEGLPYFIVRMKEVPKFQKIPREEMLRGVRINAITLDYHLDITLDDKTKQEIRPQIKQHEYYKKYILGEK